MNVIVSKQNRKQKPIRCTEEEAADIRTVAKSILDTTDSNAVVMVFSAIAEAYRKNKDLKEITLTIKKG